MPLSATSQLKQRLKQRIQFKIGHMLTEIGINEDALAHLQEWDVPSLFRCPPHHAGGNKLQRTVSWLSKILSFHAVAK